MSPATPQLQDMSRNQTRRGAGSDVPAALAASPKSSEAGFRGGDIYFLSLLVSLWCTLIQSQRGGAVELKCQPPLLLMGNKELKCEEERDTVEGEQGSKKGRESNTGLEIFYYAHSHLM